MRNRYSTGLVLLLAGAVCFVSVSAWSTGPLEVGERFPITIQPGALSDITPIEQADGRTVWRLTHPDATYISLHFAEFDLGLGEQLVISDARGRQSSVLTGNGKLGASTFWARHIKGDTAVLTLSAHAQGTFSINQYAAGFVDLSDGTEAICGIDDKENAVCYSSSHPVEYDRARAVARLLIEGRSLCTGWLVSADNLLLTNEHCISSAATALNTDYEFMAEAPTCESSNCQLCYPGVVYSGADFIQDSASLDYALVRITSGNPAAAYGFLEIDNRSAVPGEEIYIPQYPGGRAKEIGIFSTDSHDSGGVCEVYSVTEPPCSGSSFTDVGYYCDTEGGSSGSPVLASSNDKVIALHHCALCPNRGVPINLVYAEIQAFLGVCGDGTCGSGEDPCSCADDCGSPPSAEVSCTDGVDNDCDTLVDCDDVDCNSEPSCTCDSDGICEEGEDCLNCGDDCIAGSGASECGNGVCETANGEDCLSCPTDCNGKTVGAARKLFCCGADVGCGDSRCSTEGWLCSDTPAEPFCCGDGVCEGLEGPATCAIDCAGAFCGDGTCNLGEDSCNCPGDCGLPPANEIPDLTCIDALDNDCDGNPDCADQDCDTDPACQCGGVGDVCATGEDCCSGLCHPRKLTCK